MQATSGGVDGVAGGASTTATVAVAMAVVMAMTETLPLFELKAHLSEVVDRVEREHDRVVLTRNGRPAPVIPSPPEREALEDKSGDAFRSQRSGRDRGSS
jgi:prevent-host-death family protein